MAEFVVAGELVAAVRVVAVPEALDAATWPADATEMRLAPDEVLLLDVLDATAPEPHAIVFPDTGWVRFTLSPDVGAQLFEGAATWPPPSLGFGQGAIAGIPAKVFVEADCWSVVVPAGLASDFEDRLGGVLT
ncbi:MAG: hypothetical protein ACPHIC_04155 [Acidimicrobiales bacterium]